MSSIGIETVLSKPTQTHVYFCQWHAHINISLTGGWLFVVKLCSIIGSKLYRTLCNAELQWYCFAVSILLYRYCSWYLVILLLYCYAPRAGQSRTYVDMVAEYRHGSLVPRSLPMGFLSLAVQKSRGSLVWNLTWARCDWKIVNFRVKRWSFMCCPTNCMLTAWYVW